MEPRLGTCRPTQGGTRRRDLGPWRKIQGAAQADVGRQSRGTDPRAPYPGERATILDNTLFVGPPSQFVWIWDLEITTTITPRERVINESGPHPRALPRRFGDGININHTGSDVVYRGLKFIDLVVHDTRQGISFWIDAVDSEIYGCLIYDNGWSGSDHGWGHCIYTQNKNGVKTISNCIMSTEFNGAYTIHAYGSDRAYVDNYVVEDNIAYQNGPVLVGGGRPSHNIKILHNYLYGVGMRTGYGGAAERGLRSARQHHRQGEAPHRQIQEGRAGRELPDRSRV